MTDLAKAPTLPEIGALVREGRLHPQVECPLTHTFTPGLYVREVFVPARTLVVTKLHKTTHPFVISKGRIAVWTPETGIVVLEAPYSGVTKAGTIRLAIAITDTVWTTFHATDETDITILEETLATDPATFLPETEQEKLCQ